MEGDPELVIERCLPPARCHSCPGQLSAMTGKLCSRLSNMVAAGCVQLSRAWDVASVTVNFVEFLFAVQ